ncbi:MAG TPA: DapH/DapD/GlmU-related protein [Bacteroidales bacterium]|nr:DapH/DapD/GlmU-related protein [Bacteroidales bacterium]HRZ21642.1 DapH/DapD/GlmU-related protein [Bacteroidales bacterium]
MKNHPPDYFVHETAIVDDRCLIGKGTMVWHFSHLMTDCVIGENCIIGQNVFIGSGVWMGNNVKVQNNVSVYSGVVCEDDVFLGPSMVFTNVINPRSAVVRRGNYALTRVRRGATVGANATIVCGVEIGEYAFVGAGAVVTRSVAPYALVVGNPARQTGWMSEYGHRLHFDKDGRAQCPESLQWYTLKEGRVTRDG